ncbi:hypothetical protein [Planktothrix sp. FACHB-1365]|uniref:hypothetical protein n=1 Tax=Planktothrix sp. FACHB-1365 TaxID=2692855 RepID=UPI00168728F7|nr:hypothetical protein [Planktothrix sp. FACHB-1365]MBD2481133.1 hypothetical protein [Planktothrix sp. FACHB-1365]
MAIAFTDREMQRAWRENRSAYGCENPKTNAHRLLLFYAVECGLKAMYMKRTRKNRIDYCQDERFKQAQHDINKLLDLLAAGNLKLPKFIFISDIKDDKNRSEKRQLNLGQINQMWRYGGKLERWGDESEQQSSTDKHLEEKLLTICKFIEQELK